MYDGVCSESKQLCEQEAMVVLVYISMHSMSTLVLGYLAEPELTYECCTVVCEIQQKVSITIDNSHECKCYLHLMTHNHSLSSSSMSEGIGLVQFPFASFVGINSSLSSAGIFSSVLFFHFNVQNMVLTH